MPALFFFTLLLLSPQALCAAEPDMFSFAQSLAAEGDHYRAITEYKRFLHYHPQNPRAAQADLAIAKSLLAGKRWPQADEALIKVWQKYPNSPVASLARRLFASAAFERGDYPLARERYQELKTMSPADTTTANYQIGSSYLEEGQLSAAEERFQELSEPKASELQQFIADYRSLPRKSPRLAATLSAILPGAGQLYTERPEQAGVAFALNAAFIYGAIEAWNNENYTVAGLLSLFEIGWYGGNIYNAMNNAHKINREREKDFRSRLPQLQSFSLGVHHRTPWLQARFNF